MGLGIAVSMGETTPQLDLDPQQNIGRSQVGGARRKRGREEEMAKRGDGTATRSGSGVDGRCHVNHQLLFHDLASACSYMLTVRDL